MESLCTLNSSLMDFTFWAIKGEIMRLMREEKGESRVLVKAFSCGYQKGVGEPQNNTEENVRRLK